MERNSENGPQANGHPARLPDAILPLRPRIASIDILRGLVMVLMTLDHVRGSFTMHANLLWGEGSPLPGNPTDLASDTTPLLFLMRWITHLCAPVFIFLAGVSVCMWRDRRGSTHDVTRHVALRGMMLIGINTVLNGRHLLSGSGHVVLDVLWPIGVSMMLLSVAVHLSGPVLWAIGVAIVAGHNALDGVTLPGGAVDVAWRLAFASSTIELPGIGTIYALYPVLPWFGVMLLGYLSGGMFRRESRSRCQALYAAGGGCLVLFVLLRGFGGYGDPHPWAQYDLAWRTAASFVNVTKYPPSFQFLLLTLGVMSLALAGMEQWGVRSIALRTLGGTPLAYYVGHLVVVRALAAFLGNATGGGWLAGVRDVAFTVPGVLACTVLIGFALYPLCTMWAWLKKEVRCLHGGCLADLMARLAPPRKERK
ncbi:heparan-alpha-glucosaminide N-acetyltransferase domain-containing protein [Nitratidesulfovibrio sp.]|uniref:DUF1624 domain-containing protein n=1 Tax=Nitratidesulfovibrio sp. TaxID=2802297 RepID=UPI003341528F